MTIDSSESLDPEGSEKSFSFKWNRLYGKQQSSYMHSKALVNKGRGCPFTRKYLPYLVFGFIEDLVWRAKHAKDVLARIAKIHRALKYSHFGIC